MFQEFFSLEIFKTAKSVKCCNFTGLSFGKNCFFLKFFLPLSFALEAIIFVVVKDVKHESLAERNTGIVNLGTILVKVVMFMDVGLN